MWQCCDRLPCPDALRLFCAAQDVGSEVAQYIASAGGRLRVQSAILGPKTEFAQSIALRGAEPCNPRRWMHAGMLEQLFVRFI